MAKRTSNRGVHSLMAADTRTALKRWEELKKIIRPLPSEHLALWRERLEREMRALARERGREE